MSFITGDFWQNRSIRRNVRIAHAVAAALVAVSFIAHGSAAWLLAVPWVIIACGVFVLACLDAIARDRTLCGLAKVTGSGYLIVGSLALLASQAQLSPFGFREPIVELTAAHFHFAGFAASIVAANVLRASVGRIARVATVGVIASPIVVATGHFTVGTVELLGGVATTLSLFVLALATWHASMSSRSARTLVRACSFAVVVPMALALQYGWSRATGIAHLDYFTIAEIHGSLNAVGFACGSLLGWHLETSKRGSDQRVENTPGV